MGKQTHLIPVRRELHALLAGTNTTLANYERYCSLLMKLPPDERVIWFSIRGMDERLLDWPHVLLHSKATLPRELSARLSFDAIPWPDMPTVDVDVTAIKPRRDGGPAQWFDFPEDLRDQWILWTDEENRKGIEIWLDEAWFSSDTLLVSANAPLDILQGHFKREWYADRRRMVSGGQRMTAAIDAVDEIGPIALNGCLGEREDGAWLLVLPSAKRDDVADIRSYFRSKRLLVEATPPD